jgi:hypothetical protein
LVITEEILPILEEYREELERNTTNNSLVSTIKGEICGFFGELATLGTIHLCLPGVLDPLGVFTGAGIAAAEKAAKIFYEYRKKPKFTVQDPLSSIVFYLDELKSL